MVTLLMLLLPVSDGRVADAVHKNWFVYATKLAIPINAKNPNLADRSFD
jgi:hypothetical protein